MESNEKNIFFKKNSGITLIALIVTVSVILILVGVGVKSIHNHNLVNQTSKISNTYEEQQAKETLLMHLENLKLKAVKEKIRNKNDKIQLLKEINGKEDGAIEVTLNDDSNKTVYTNTFDSSNQLATVKIDGFAFYVDGNLNAMKKLSAPKISDVEWEQNEYGQYEAAYVIIETNKDYTLNLDLSLGGNNWIEAEKDITYYNDGYYQVGTKSEYCGFPFTPNETIVAMVEDNQGNYSEIASKELKESGAPTITSVRQTEKTSNTATLEVVASDSESGIFGIEVYDLYDDKILSGTYEPTGKNTYKVTITGLNPGTYITVAGVRVSDACGNTNINESFSIETTE